MIRQIELHAEALRSGVLFFCFIAEYVLQKPVFFRIFAKIFFRGNEIQKRQSMITKQALGNTLFGMADILRDKVEDYKSYILSMLFFKRLSDNYLWENVCSNAVWQVYPVKTMEK